MLGTKDLDLVVLENVGNLVCPAEFDTCASKNVMILSVPEGHDKPLKYPLMFSVCDALIINKMDVLPYFDFDMDKVCGFSRRRNPNIQIFPISAKTGEGLDELFTELEKYAGEGPHLFPDDMITDQPERQICAELVREKLLKCLDKEIPHGTGGAPVQGGLGTDAADRRCARWPGPDSRWEWPSPRE